MASEPPPRGREGERPPPGARYEGVDDELVRRADERTGLNKPLRFSSVLGRFLRDGEDYPPADRFGEELRGEDGGDELIRLADSLPGRSTGWIEGDLFISVKTDFDGTTWRGVGPHDPNAPVQWTVTVVGEYWASRGVKLGPTDRPYA